tara:strand:+ start:3126 stop:4124 length:999 start_codon:yes stop_codon:yes gene_type:complete
MEQIIEKIKSLKKYFKNADGSDKVDENGQKMIKPPISDNTIKGYIKDFNKIKGDDDNSIFKDIKKVNEKMKKLGVYENENTRKKYYNSIISVLNVMDGFNPSAYSNARDLLNKKYIADNSTGIISEKQKPNFAEKKEFDGMIETIRKEVNLKNLKTKQKLTPQEKNLFQLFVLLQLFRIYPTRNEMATIKKISKDNFDELEDKKGNWLIVDKKGGMELYFDIYKTKKSLGTNRFKVAPVPKRLLNSWLKHRDEGDSVFIQVNGKPLTKNNLTKMLQRASVKYMDGKKISTTMIRKIYVSDKYNDVKKEQEKDAKIMGHSKQTQDLVYNKSKD